MHTPIRHKLKECTMMKNYMTMGTFAKGKKPKGDLEGKAAMPFPGEEVVMSIYVGSIPHKSCRKLKLMSQGINAISTAHQSPHGWG
jgi:hypothetical protein